MTDQTCLLRSRRLTPPESPKEPKSPKAPTTSNRAEIWILAGLWSTSAALFAFSFALFSPRIPVRWVWHAAWKPPDSKRLKKTQKDSKTLTRNGLRKTQKDSKRLNAYEFPVKPRPTCLENPSMDPMSHRLVARSPALAQTVATSHLDGCPPLPTTLAEAQGACPQGS